jgi:hypothetical protein
MRKVARRAIFFANFKENAIYIANIFDAKKYGEIGFKKTSSLFVFRVKKSCVKMLMKSTPDGSMVPRYDCLLLFGEKL